MLSKSCVEILSCALSSVAWAKSSAIEPEDAYADWYVRVKVQYSTVKARREIECRLVFRQSSFSHSHQLHVRIGIPLSPPLYSPLLPSQRPVFSVQRRAEDTDFASRIVHFRRPVLQVDYSNEYVESYCRKTNFYTTLHLLYRLIAALIVAFNRVARVELFLFSFSPLLSSLLISSLLSSLHFDLIIRILQIKVLYSVYLHSLFTLLVQLLDFNNIGAVCCMLCCALSPSPSQLLSSQFMSLNAATSYYTNILILYSSSPLLNRMRNTLLKK